MNGEAEAIRVMFKTAGDLAELLEAFQGRDDDPTRRYLISRRQTLLMELGAIEDVLGLPRSVVPKHKRS